MVFYRHVMRCVGRRVGGEIKEMHGGVVNVAVSRNKNAHFAMCQNRTAVNWHRYKSMTNKARKESSFKSNEREGCRGAN